MAISLEGISGTVGITNNTVSLIETISIIACNTGPGSRRLGLAVRQGEDTLVVEEKVAILTGLAGNLIIEIGTIGNILEALT